MIATDSSTAMKILKLCEKGVNINLCDSNPPKSTFLHRRILMHFDVPVQIVKIKIDQSGDLHE